MVQYITASEVREWLGVSSDKYSDSFLDTLIQEKMDYVNRLSNMAWYGERGTVTDRFDITRWKGGYFGIYLGIPCHLRHNHIVSVTSLKIWDGDTWEEWVGNKTEGRGSDYWVNKEEGIVYINMWVIWRGGKEIEITYTYGRDDLPNEIKELTRLLVVKDLLLRERFSVAVPEGGEGIRIAEMLRYINDRIKRLEQMIQESLLCEKAFYFDDVKHCRFC